MFSIKGIKDNNVSGKPERLFYPYFLSREVYSLHYSFQKTWLDAILNMYPPSPHTQSKRKERRQFKVAWSKAPGNFSKPMHSVTRFVGPNRKKHKI